jgi:predicted TIM-barrel fold metal-dependent hydrolase
MRIVALEEHFVIPEMTQRIPPGMIAGMGWPRPEDMPAEMARPVQLKDLGDARLADMDDAGITLQVLSLAGPGADVLPVAESISFARDLNDRMAATCALHPTRYASFAHLPLTDPAAAADELERAVKQLGFHGAMINGTVRGKFLDDPSFAPIFSRAEDLGVPIYLHPAFPPKAIRDTYSSGLTPQQGTILATSGWGWHAETAVHILRMMCAGVFDRHPGLQMIVGHMGEMMPMMLARFDFTFGHECRHLKRKPSETILDHVHITTSAFFSIAPFMAAMLSFGADRIMFSVDYPFSANKDGTDFLKNLPVSPTDLKKIAHQNADKLLKLKT